MPYHGKGAFVCEEKIAMPALTCQGVRSRLEKKERMVNTQLPDASLTRCDALIARRLSLEPQRGGSSRQWIKSSCQGKEIYGIRCKRSAGGIPVNRHRSFVPVSLCEDPEKFDLQNEQLREILSKHYGLTRSGVTKTPETYLADAEPEQQGLSSNISGFTLGVTRSPSVLNTTAKRRYPVIPVKKRICGGLK